MMSPRALNEALNGLSVVPVGTGLKASPDGTPLKSMSGSVPAATVCRSSPQKRRLGRLEQLTQGFRNLGCLHLDDLRVSLNDDECQAMMKEPRKLIEETPSVLNWVGVEGLRGAARIIGCSRSGGIGRHAGFRILCPRA